MTDKQRTPEKFHGQDKNATCQSEITLDDMHTHSCDLPKGHSGEHKSLDYIVDDSGNTVRIAVLWVKLNKTSKKG